MSRIWAMMDIGKRSMMNSQSALQTTSHNISNRTTPGYSRQRVELTTNDPIGVGRLQMGTGARPTKVTRVNNEYLERQVEQEQGRLGYLRGRHHNLARVENVFNEQATKGINRFMADFFNSVRELSNNPESLAIRTQVKESASFLGKDFARAHGQLTDIQRDIDNQIRNKVHEINEMTSEIAQLNEKIQVVELNGVPANDERDKRDELVKRLSESINIRYAEGEDGALNITAGNSAILVSGHTARELEVASTPAREGKREGNFDLIYRSSDNATPFVVTNQFKGGEIGGLLDVRDRVVNDFIKELDTLAYNLGKEVNRAHTIGYNQYNETNNLFFEDINSVEDAALNLKITSKVNTDVGTIAAAATPNSPGDNRVANVLSTLQYKKTLEDGTSTFDDFYNNMVGRVGIETGRAASAHESQKDIYKQIKNIRESVSGVSLDEETTKLIEYQKSFDASARMIRAADEMMDTVLNLRRY